MLVSGTSPATALVSGLVSQLLVSGRATAATAKAALIAISVARKGFYVGSAPRAAQYVEVTCDDENAPQVVIPTFPAPSPFFQVDLNNHIGTSADAESALEVSALRLFTSFFLSAIATSCNSFCSDLGLLTGTYPRFHVCVKDLSKLFFFWQPSPVLPVLQPQALCEVSLPTYLYVLIISAYVPIGS